MAPRIFIFSIVLGAKYLSYVKSIETHARAFLTLLLKYSIYRHCGTCRSQNLFFLKTLHYYVHPQIFRAPAAHEYAQLPGGLFNQSDIWKKTMYPSAFHCAVIVFFRHHFEKIIHQRAMSVQE